MVKIPLAPWKTRSFSTESCKKCQVESLSASSDFPNVKWDFVLWQGPSVLDWDPPRWPIWDLQIWRGHWGPSPCANPTCLMKRDPEEPQLWTFIMLSPRCKCHFLPFALDQGSPGWRYGLCPEPCKGLERTITIAVPQKPSDTHRDKFSWCLLKKFLLRIWKRLHRDMSRGFYCYVLFLKQGCTEEQAASKCYYLFLSVCHR